MEKIAGALAALVMVATIGLAAPADARDTGWDCKGCKTTHAVR